MPARIIDEFTDLPVSRKRKYQMRNAARRRCVVCGQKATHGLVHGKKHPHCDKHWELFKQRKVKSKHKRRSNFGQKDQE